MNELVNPEKDKIKVETKSRSIAISLEKLSIISFQLYFVTLFIFVDSVKYNFLSEIAFVIFAGFTIILILSDGKLYAHDYIKYLSLFIIYSGITTLWAINPSYVVIRLKTLLQIFIMSIFVYQVFYKTQKFESLRNLFVITGVLFFGFTILTYGFNGLISALLGGIRLGKEISQENVFGMYASTLGVIYLYMIIYEKKYKYFYLFSMMIVLITASGSRKAFLTILFGFIVILLMKFGLKRFYKIILYLLIGGITSYIVLQMPIFNLVLQRVSELVDVLSGGQSDYSAVLRKEFIISGLHWFYNRPLNGYGVDNYQILASMYLGTPSYAHNNYIELLVNGGIIGFTTYYVMYYKVLAKLIKRVRIKSCINNILILIFSMFLFYDTASVSYLTKINYIFIAIGFAYVKRYYYKNEMNKIKGRG